MRGFDHTSTTIALVLREGLIEMHIDGDKIERDGNQFTKASLSADPFFYRLSWTGELLEIGFNPVKE